MPVGATRDAAEAATLTPSSGFRHAAEFARQQTPTSDAGGDGDKVAEGAPLSTVEAEVAVAVAAAPAEAAEAEGGPKAETRATVNTCTAAEDTVTTE